MLFVYIYLIFSKMKPLVKIRLMKVRRHLIGNLLTYFYPPIFILFFSLFVIKGINNEPDDEIKGSNQTLNLFETPSKFDLIGLICETEDYLYCDEFYNHLQLYSKNLPVKLTESTIINEVNNDRSFKLIFTIKQKGDALDFDVRFSSVSYKSVYESANELYIASDTRSTTQLTNFKNSQKIIANFIKSKSTQSPSHTLSIEEMPLTRPKIYNSNNSGFYYYVLPICISIGQSTALFNIMSWMITEREQKIDEFTKRQGISKTTYLVSWFITYFVLTIIPSIINCILLQIFFFKHFVLLWMIIMEIVFMLNIFGLAFFVQSLVNKTQTGNLLMKVIILGISVLSAAIARPEINVFAKLLFCLFPQVTQVLALQALLNLDNFDTGIDLHLLFTAHNGLSFGGTLFIFIITFALYIAAASLIIYWKLKGTVQRGERNNKITQDKDMNLNHQELLTHNVQLKQNGEVLEIKNVSRSYGYLKAVNGFSGELFKNEIFCLLGHNGAGKTTLIKMLSGLENPDGGDILLNGKSIVEDKEYLFRNLGLCAQEDIFFDYLTVSEHLQYMCEIKGAAVSGVEITTLLSKIALADKMYSVCGTLSGGQKRKLCIALALIGNSRLILLDEPTSGMDVVAKRELWEFLKNYKDNKIIILTTHSLDEAEYLGDRIGIMSEGKFICSGSSSYLKNKYPCGFNVNFIFNHNIFTKDKRMSLVNTFRQLGNNCKIKVSSKFAFTINFFNITNDVEQIFENIDNVKESYGIINYTVSTTTLEDVFLKLNDSDTDSNDNNDNDEIIQQNTNTNLYQKTNDLISFQHDIPSLQKNSSSFCSQIISGTKRNSLTLWRGFSLFLLEIIASSATIYIYGIGLFQLISTDSTALQNLNYLLTHRDVYTFTNIAPSIIPFRLEDSTYYKDTLNENVNFVSLEKYGITLTDDITTISDKLYTNHKYKNAQSAVVIKETEPNNIQIYVLYSQTATDFYQSTMNLVMSAYFEKYYNMKITLGTSYAGIPPKSNGLTEAITLILKIILCLFLLVVGFQSFSSYILLNPLRERISNIKHLLYLSGANMLAYWINIFFIEVFKALCFLIFVTPIYLYMQVNLIITYPLIICFIFNLVAYCCCWSFIIRKEEQAQTHFLIANLLLFVIFGGIWVFITGGDSELPIGFYDLIPISSFAVRLFQVAINMISGTGPFNSKVTDGLLIGCGVQIVSMCFYLFVLFLFQTRFLGKLWNKILVGCSYNNYEFAAVTDVDMYQSMEQQPMQMQKPMQIQQQPMLMQPQTPIQESMQMQPAPVPQLMAKPVQMTQPLLQGQMQMSVNKFAEKEKNKVCSNSNNLTVSINQLRKTYYICGCRKKNIRAVNDLYLGLESNEKFGLLGFNGSGKTTTFKAITNEIFFDSGNITLFGVNTKTNFERIRKSIGYCPQENALFPQLTVKEVITYYKELKEINTSTTEICERFGLGKYLNTKTSHLSGGNKRKLIFAIALMGDPSLLLLDEPSTGVDPESRRIMWKNINRLSEKKDQYNMILTTHSLEEAEILCDTVSWLKHGNFVCIGNPEQLKLEFSTGYRLHVSFVENPQLQVDVNAAINHLKQMFPNANVSHLISSPIFLNHYTQLMSMINLLHQFCRLIEIQDIGKDFSFKLNIIVTEGKEGKVFSCILKQKVQNNYVSEVNIGMKSLEDILTRF